jgi:hypothetical protein
MRLEKGSVAEETSVEWIAVIHRIHPLLWRMRLLGAGLIAWMFRILFFDSGDGDEVLGELCQIGGRRRCIALDEEQPIGYSGQT